MTCLRPDKTEVWDLTTHFRTKFPEVVTLPQYFKTKGYQTQANGKIYHDPASAQDSLSWTESELHTVTEFEDKYANSENLDNPEAGGSTGKILHAAATEISENPGEKYIDIKVRNAALNFIKNGRTEPFFLALGFRRPHLPFSAPKEFWELYQRDQFYPFQYEEPPLYAPELAFHNFGELRNYTDIPREGALSIDKIAELRHGYYAASSYIDHQVGLVLESLKENGLLDNTVIVLTSDHGYHLGEQGLWCKITNFELDTRVPLIIKKPNQQEQKKSDALVELVDLYPTMVELCDLEIPKNLDGKSMVHLLSKPAATHKKYAVSQFQRPFFFDSIPEIMGYSIRSTEMRYTEWVRWSTKEPIARELYDYRLGNVETKNRINETKYQSELLILKKAMANIINRQ